MLRLRASRAVDHVGAAEGRTVTMTSRTWGTAVRVGAVGLAVAYHRPLSVAVDTPGGVTLRARVTDHIMVGRAAAVLLLLAVRLTRRRPT